MPPLNNASREAFSLIELLVVIAIVVLLAVAAVPAFSTISEAQGVPRGIHDLAGLLELARSEAVARKTYVWMGIGTTNDAGNAYMVFGAVYSKDGSGTGTNLANLAPLSRVIRVRNLTPVAWDALNQQTKDIFTNYSSTNSPASVAANTNGIAFQLGQMGFQRRTITFTPRGEALLEGVVGPDDGYTPWIDVSFRQSRGGVVMPGGQDASVLVEGATGLARILRVQ